MKTPALRLSTCALLLASLAALPACGRKKTADPGSLPEVDLVALERSRGKGKGQSMDADIEKFEYLHEDKERGHKTLLTADRAEPGPQGTRVLTQPRATLALAPHRVLVLSAPKATFTVPKQHPRDGLFSGTAEDPVVFTLYQCAEGKTPDLAGTADIRMKVYFEGDARFDLERDAVLSDAPVQVTGPALEFRGTGVQMTWNRLEQRMEQFDIAKGEVLVARQEKQEKQEKAATARPSPVTAAQDKETKTARLRRARSLFQAGDQDLTLHWSGPLILRPVALPEDATEAQKAQAKAKPRYDATLTGDITGHLDAPKPEAEADFTGDRLDMQFAMSAAEATKDAKPGADPKASPPLGAPLVGGEDVLHLSGDAKKPASVRTGRNDSIQATALSFSRGSGRVSAKGAADLPVVLRTPQGWLTGRNLDLDPGTGKAFVFGPGRLEAMAQLPAEGTAKPAVKKDGKNDGKAETKPLQLTYADHIEMDFTTEKAKPGETPRLGDPVETRLFGDVRGDHPDFALTCGRLAIGFAKDADAKPGVRKGKVNPARVDLSEGREGPTPQVTLRDPKQGNVTIKAPAMRLALETAGGRTAPSGFTANGPVEAVQGDGSTLACDRLDVDFLPPGAKNGEKNGEKNDSKAGAVAALHAAGHARYTGLADGKQAQLEADRFTVDARQETLELTGTPQKHAKVESQGMSLSGEHVSLKKAGGVARVAGPGRLTLLTKDKQHLAVSWQGKMGWNDAEGLGYFEKRVECAADAPNGTSTLHADDSLRLAVDPAAKDGDKRKEAKDREIRLADARGKVVFAGAQNDADGNLAGRVRVDGPNLVLRNEATAQNPQGAQTVTVTGKGLMLVENFGAAKKKADAPAEAFGGQGATYFAWTKRMTMDLAKNDLHLLHDVEIRHLPLKADRTYAKMAEAVILNCQEAHADLSEGGGLGGLHGAKKPGAKAAAKPETKAGPVELRGMTADYGLLLRRGDARIECDHLRYDGGKKTAELWSNPPRKVELSGKGQENPAAADRVIWHVDTDTLDVEHPSGGAMPKWK